MKILFVASEVAPFSKSGGLGDVAGALPAALAARGHDVKVVTPRYGEIKDPRLVPAGFSLSLRFPFGIEQGVVHSVKISERHEVLFLENAHFFDRQGLYGDVHGEFGDNHRRFAYLSVGALQTAERLVFTPDILHLNDWQTGLAAVALKQAYRHTPLARARSVLTIHNLAYQGQFGKDVMEDLGLPWELFTSEGGLEFYDTVSFLKAGLNFADALTTVSPTYAEEIQGPELGANLDSLLRRRRQSLSGIINGIDTVAWNPARDGYLAAPFDADNLSGKAQCKRSVLEQFGLVPSERPLFAVVSRFAHQKGMDLLLAVLPQLLSGDAQVLVLGSGDPGLEEAFRSLQRRFPDKLGVFMGFDEALSHRLEAGADFFLMPSRYEPCGLNQLYSLRYGTVPIVRATGGLADTVMEGPAGTGLVFHGFHPGDLGAAIQRALALYAQPELMRETRRRGMLQDFSWDLSAARYEALYGSLVPRS